MKSDQKILILTHNYPRWPGDYAGVFLEELVKHFRASQIFVQIVAPHFQGSARRERGDYLEIRRFRYAPPGMETLAYAGNMHQRIRSLRGLTLFVFFSASFFFSGLRATIWGKPQLIFAQWLFPSGVTGLLISIVTRKRLFVTSHGTDIALLQKSKFLRLIARLVLHRSKLAFTVSHYLRETALDFDVAVPEKLRVCPMPARTDLFGKQQVIEHKPQLILAVARLSRQKHLDVLFKALKILMNEKIEFQCEVYGEGDEEETLRTWLVNLQLMRQVSIKKSVSQAELAKIYPSARVTVLPSIGEGFGMTLVEAQLSGSAVIGARSGGITDIIVHEKTGLLFEPGNATQLAAQLKALLIDDDLHHRLITEAKRAAEGKFSPEVIAGEYRKALGI